MNNIWEILDEEFKKNPELQAGDTLLVDIDQVEKEIGLKFSAPYKNFIKKYGGAIVGGNFIFGLKQQRSMDDYLWSVTQNTNFFKEEQEWPDIEDWYIISDDGRGNPIGIDPQGVVWLSDHDAGFEKVKLADNFEEFLYKLHTDTLYDD